MDARWCHTSVAINRGETRPHLLPANRPSTSSGQTTVRFTASIGDCDLVAYVDDREISRMDDREISRADDRENSRMDDREISRIFHRSGSNRRCKPVGRLPELCGKSDFMLQLRNTPGEHCIIGR